MQSTTVNIGQKVWITSGLDKGKEGTVLEGGWGVYSVKLDAETKTFDRNSVTTEDPKSHTIPLPPNFLPTEFKMGDKVEVHEHKAGDMYNGLKGVIVRLPTSTSYRYGGDPRYGMEVRGQGNKEFTIGNRLYFEPQHLRKPVEKERYVGDEIGHDAVQIGDTIRVELRSSDGDYAHTSTKTGKVARIVKRVNTDGLEPWDIYSFANKSHHGLNFQSRNERVYLLEIAVDPYVEIVNNLGAGTIVILEKDTGEILTFVKSLPFTKQSQWHKVSSSSSHSSTFVDDRDIIELLGRGAKIVHKVRKVKYPSPPPF